VIHIDTFGNCVTTIPLSALPGGEGSGATGVTVEIEAGDGPVRVDGLSASYDSVGAGEMVVLAGSSGLLEIAINGGHLAGELGLERGAPVRLVPGQPEERQNP